MMTKEQLIAENAKLEKSVDGWIRSDQTIRKDFAIVLGQSERDTYSLSHQSPKDLSWREIFCEVGKLLQYQNREVIERRITALEERTAPRVENLVSN